MENTDELGDVSTYQAPSIGEPRLISFLRTALNNPEHESIFQDVLDLGYNEWQKPEHEHTWGFEDMVHWVASQFGEVAALIIMFGKFNQQVENGGITQWLDNGYASDSKARRRHSWATISPDMDLSLLEEMLEGLTSVPLGNLPSAVKVSHILDDIRSTIEDANEECRECRNHRYVRCEVCDGAGTIVDEDNEDEDVEDQECSECHGEGEVPCQNCNPDGTLEMDSEEGEVPTEQFERLDKYYYSFNQAWESEIENYLKGLIRSASGGGLLSRAQAIKATESIINLLDRILEAQSEDLDELGAIVDFEEPQTFIWAEVHVPEGYRGIGETYNGKVVRFNTRKTPKYNMDFLITVDDPQFDYLKQYGRGNEELPKDWLTPVPPPAGAETGISSSTVPPPKGEPSAEEVIADFNALRLTKSVLEAVREVAKKHNCTTYDVINIFDEIGDIHTCMAIYDTIEAGER